MEDSLDKVIDIATTKFGAEYVEIRAQRLHRTMVTVKEERIEAAKQGIEAGAALRLLVNGSWGFASTGTLDYTILEKAVSEACRMARSASSKLKKPIELMEYLIKTYSNECECVLDFAVGSGSTCVAAKELNRRYVGIEIEPKYVEIARGRLDG